jgi:hypothetical protein
MTPVLHFASSRAVKGLFLPGARAIAASTSAWLVGNFLEEPVDFIFLGLSKADDVKVVTTALVVIREDGADMSKFASDRRSLEGIYLRSRCLDKRTR